MEPAEQHADQADLAAAVTEANSLLLSSLSVGDQPSDEEPQLDARIAAYRAAISKMSSQLGPEVVADAAQLSSRDQSRSAAAQQPGDAAAAMVPGLGREGVDYTVGSADDLDPSEWQVPPHCIPIHANVTTFDWQRLASTACFDVVMMDPPWQLATANPTRGVALGYSQLTDHDIRSLPIPQLQASGGFLFVWVINSKYQFTLDLFDAWGYTLVDEIVWVKMTVNRRLFKSHGYYLQHAKEVCMVARKNPSPQELQQQQQQDPQQQQQAWQQQVVQQHARCQAQFPEARGSFQQGQCGVGSDIIFSERRGQSQKPEEIYELIEALVPDGKYLEIFARKNNLRNFWVSIGNEVTGTGLPEADMQAFQQTSAIPGAVYGRGSATSSAAAAAAAGAGAAAAGGS